MAKTIEKTPPQLGVAKPARRTSSKLRTVERVPSKLRKVSTVTGGAISSRLAADSSAISTTDPTAGLSADVTDEMLAGAPTFGNLLSSIAAAVLGAQEDLDASVAQTVSEMADTTIEVATTVIQHLNDDGLPSAEDTEVITQELSLLNFALPPLVKFDYVALSMKLRAESVDAKSGITFKQAGGTVGFGAGGGAGWAADLSLMFGSTSIESRRMTDLAQNEIALDAQLGERAATKPPDPVKMRTGPTILINANRLPDRVDMTVPSKPVSFRRLELTITLFSTTGQKLGGKALKIDGGVFGTLDGTTGAEGTAGVGVLQRMIERKADQPEGQFTLTATYGDMSRELAATL